MWATGTINYYCVQDVWKKVIREKRIPFEVSLDPFYSEQNVRYLEKIVSDSGKAKLVEHELIEE